MKRESRGGGRPVGYPKTGGRQKGALTKADVRKTVAKLATKEGCGQLAINAPEIAELVMNHLRAATDPDKFFGYVGIIAPFIWLTASEIIASPKEESNTFEAKPLTEDEIKFLKSVRE